MPRGPRKLLVTFRSRSLTHSGGAYLLHRLFSRLRLQKRLTQEIRVAQRNNRSRVGEMLLAPLYPMTLGLERIETTQLLRQNGVFQYLSGLPSYPDASTLRRFLLRVAPTALPRLRRLQDRFLRRMTVRPGSTSQASLAGVDSPTRFSTLWRYTYRTGEAIVFANGTHVELDGPGGLSSGPRALVEKKKRKYRLRDYSERGKDEKAGMPGGDGQPAPIVDALQRTLWLMENRPAQLAEFLREAHPNREQMRLVAQALAGPALKGGELPDVSSSGELAALTKLLANWKSVVEDAAVDAWDQGLGKHARR